MRRAEWRRRGDDPTTSLGWWWRDVVDRRALLYAALPFAVVAVIGAVGGGWGWMALAAANLAFLATRPPRTGDRLRELLPDPAPPGLFRARVAYRRNGVLIGKDEMGLAVVDGWLVGEGVRSYFALRPRDPYRWEIEYAREAKMGMSDGSSIELWWDGGEGPGRTLSSWRESRIPVAGESMFPPARVHPEEMARWQRRCLLAPALFGIAAGGPNLLFAGAETRILLMTGLSVVAFGVALRTFRAFEALVAVEGRALREEREALVGPLTPGGRRLEGERQAEACGPHAG